MPIFKYKNHQLSKNINCFPLGDCTNSTITSNATRTLAKLTNNKYSEKKYADTFHTLLESTAITSIASIKYKNLRPIAKLGASAVAILYITGRLMKKKKRAPADNTG